MNYMDSIPDRVVNEKFDTSLFPAMVSTCIEHVYVVSYFTTKEIDVDFVLLTISSPDSPFWLQVVW